MANRQGKGSVYIISGVSGSGKSTVSDRIVAAYPTISRSIAVTSRAPRQGELFGYHYYFVSPERFEWLIETNQLLEYTQVYTNDYYGTLKYSVEQVLEKGHSVLFVVDTRGVEQITQHMPDAKVVFLKAPSDEEQLARLERRGTSGEDLLIRVQKAHEELAWAKARNLPIVTNDDLETALQEIIQLFDLQRFLFGMRNQIGSYSNQFAEQGYRQLAADELNYQMPQVIPELLRRYSIQEEKLSVLDLGCGPGNLKDFTSFKYYAGVDLSPRMLKEAGESGYQELILAPVEEYIKTLPNSSFDIIFALSKLYFLDEKTTLEVIQQIDGVAKLFWVISLDGAIKRTVQGARLAGDRYKEEILMELVVKKKEKAGQHR